MFMARSDSRRMASQSDNGGEDSLKSDRFDVFFLEALSQSDIIIKLKSAVGYDEDKLSKKIINELNTEIKVLEKDLAKMEDRIIALEQQVQFLAYTNDEHEQYL